MELGLKTAVLVPLNVAKTANQVWAPLKELASLYNVKLSSTVKSQDVADCTPDRSQYTECVVGRVKKDMMNLLGCLPPWVEQSADTCTKSVPYNHTLHKEISLHTEDLISGNTKAVQCRQESKI